MRTLAVLVGCIFLLITGCLSPPHPYGQAAPSSGGVPPFDYFENSWSVIGLKDYNDGTRVTPDNQLVLADKVQARLSYGRELRPLSREQTKTLLQGWLPVVLLCGTDGLVQYEFTLWAAPLPSVNDWRAAYDWPTEGENFVNWVLVKVTNNGQSEAAAAVTLDFIAPPAAAEKAASAPAAATAPTGIAKAPPGRMPIRKTWRLAAGASKEAAVAVPYRPVADEAALQKEDVRVWLGRTVEYWTALMARAARIEVPCRKAREALLAAHVCQLIAADHGQLHGGEGFYDEFYIRDGGYQIMELEEAGLQDVAAKAIESYLRSQRPDGRFESQADELDGNGQALWVLWQYYKITEDRAWLERAYPQMRRAVDWMMQARRKAPADSPFVGLLPAAFADGESLPDRKHHIVGYDLWNLRGLLCTADATRILGKTAEVDALEREAAQYRAAIDAACRRTGVAYFPPSWEKDGTSWGNTETLWPTELFERSDPRVTATLKYARREQGGGFVEGTIRWLGTPDAIHPYLSAYTTMTTLLRGDDAQVVEDFYWYLLHSSASNAFPEGIFYKRRVAWSDTIPHVTGASNFALMLRHMLVHEAPGELHLLTAVPDWWLEDGREIAVQNAPTHFGVMSLRVTGAAEGVRAQLEPPTREPPARIILHLPVSRPLLEPVAGVEVVSRPDQKIRWDYERVLKLYESHPLSSGKAHGSP